MVMLWRGLGDSFCAFFLYYILIDFMASNVVSDSERLKFWGIFSQCMISLFLLWTRGRLLVVLKLRVLRSS